MKLRMLSNSLRLRLTKSEVAILMQMGSIEERVEFPNLTELLYGLKTSPDTEALTARFERGVITVLAPEDTARTWANTDQVGMAGQSGKLALLVEKDFQCVHGEQDPDAFEGHPVCETESASTDTPEVPSPS